MKIILLCGFLFLGCATNTIQLPKEQDQVVKNSQPGISQIRYKIIKVENETDARAMVANHRSYFSDMFTQSTDPYFGSNRWSDQCVKDNKLDAIQSDGEGTHFNAALTADARLKVGFCAQDAVHVLYVAGNCKKTGTFYEFSVVGPKAISFSCPDKLTFR